MNWIDNIISIVSPRKGYERAVWRQELELTKKDHRQNMFPNGLL